MRIPNGPAGSPCEDLPMLSNTKLRTYGAAGFLMLAQEDEQGCPRQYRKRYVEQAVAAEKRSPQLSYGSMFHRVLYEMEEHAIGPEEALSRVWPADLDTKFWREANEDLAEYMARGGPMVRYGTIDVEQYLFAELYVDDDFGPVWFGGVIDWLGIDVEQPSTLHVVDYKTNRWPPSKDDVQGDAQLKGYDFLTRANWTRWMAEGTRPDTVMHLDATKWYDIEARFSQAEIDEWQEWASAIARTILRDEEGKARLTSGCAWCPVKHDCPAYQSLPDTGALLPDERRNLATIGQMWEWRERAAATVKALKAGIDEVDGLIKAKTNAEGSTVVPGRKWELDVAYGNEVDLQALYERLSPSQFLQVVSTSKTRLAEWISQQPDSHIWSSLIDDVISRVPTGTKVKTSKMKE